MTVQAKTNYRSIYKARAFHSLPRLLLFLKPHSQSPVNSQYSRIMSSTAEILDGLAAARLFDLQGVVAVVTGGGTVRLIAASDSLAIFMAYRVSV